MRRHRHYAIPAVLVAAVFALVGLPSASGTQTSGLSRAQSVNVHLLAQQGLAIALANNVLQTNFVLLEVGYPGSTGGKTNTCANLGGTGLEILKLKRPSKTETDVTYRIYYDVACTKPYITQTAVVTSSHGGNDIAATESSTYQGLTGRKLGVFTAKASADDTDAGVSLRGLGSLRANGSSTPASLGLTCFIPEQDGASTVDLSCAGGIAQKFSKLGLTLGSLTPLALVAQSDSSSASGFGRVDFSGSTAALRTSTAKLAVGYTSAKALTLVGTSKTAGSDATKGTAAQFAMFTPRPTGWTITDAKAHTTFSISVVTKSLRLTGRVIDTKTKSVLATLALDRSGTGTITYRGAKPAKVTSWLLSS